MGLYERVSLALSSPALVVREFNRTYYRLRNGRNYNEDGVDIFAEEWDNLLVLDACRFDTFDERAAPHLPGRLESRRSRGSATVEWLHGNFSGDLTDTVYVTANPQYEVHKSDLDVEFHDVVHLWNSDEWDDETGTVLPAAVTEAAIAAAETYPQKRLLVHYMQPHFPFLTDAGPLGTAGFDDDRRHIWMQIQTGALDIGPAEIRDAYHQTLDRAVPAISEAVERLPGKTVVTADHGNIFGERAGPLPVSTWGHPRHLHCPALVTVPWLVIKGERRRTSHSGESVDREGIDGNVKDRLQQLGYA